ncbi:UNKNOWN [Stylonychia lemnae]|uniref:Lebercilin domain-containing protein n=1 Tax=Stylonychia lemnae TaxID=5949 RepID=A0A078B6G0_STYLE|nr:UNKNOWN [Stylonychia lemnae]|eukprot:CDW89959.1 UNKNOWN [Stylonychia lemnae]
MSIKSEISQSQEEERFSNKPNQQETLKEVFSDIKGTLPDYEKSAPNIALANNNNYNNNLINSSSQVKSSSNNQMREILLEKENQNQKLREINNQLKDKIQKLSQALDISLANQRSYQDSSIRQQQQNIIGSENQQAKPQREVMQKNLKLKEKEIQAYATIIASLKKQNEQLKSKLEHKEGMNRVLDLEDKLKESERQRAELQKEVKSMQRIQQDQGKALDKLVNEGDYPNKIKSLMEQLKLAKEKIRELEDKSRKDDKNSLQVQDYLIKLEEQNRELKNKMKSKQVNANQGQSMITELNQNESSAQINQQQQQVTSNSHNQNGVVAFSDNSQVEELQRINAILMRAKEVQYKKGQYLKLKFEKKQEKFNAIIEQLNNKVTEQDKSYLEIENMIQNRQVQNKSGKINEQYTKMREITEKYSKLPLKPGFGNGTKLNSRLNNLSIDVNSNEFKSNQMTLIPIQQNGDATNRTVVAGSSIGVKSTQNRSKSIDPTAKRLAKIPQTTRKTKIGGQNLQNLKGAIYEDMNGNLIQDIELNTSEIQLESSKQKLNPPSNLLSPHEFEKVDDFSDRKIRDLEKETDELLARFQAQNQTYGEQSNQIIETSLNYDAFQNLDGDISKLNDDMQDEDINQLMNEYQ